MVNARILKFVPVFAFCVVTGGCYLKKNSAATKSLRAQVLEESDLEMYSTEGKTAADALVKWEKELLLKDAESDVPLVPRDLALLGKVRLRLGAKDDSRVSEHPYFLDDEQALILRKAALMAIARMDPRRDPLAPANFYDACNKADTVGPGKKLLKPMLCWQGFNKDAMAYIFRKGEFNFDRSAIDGANALLDLSNPKRAVQFEFYVEPMGQDAESISSPSSGNFYRQVMLISSSATKGVTRFFFNDSLAKEFRVVMRPDSFEKKLVKLDLGEYGQVAEQKTELALAQVQNGKFDEITRELLKKNYGIRKDEHIEDVFDLSETFRRQETLRSVMRVGEVAVLGAVSILSVPVLIAGPQAMAAGFLAHAAAHTGEVAILANYHAGLSYGAALAGFFNTTIEALQMRRAISDWGAGKSRERALTALVILDRAGFTLNTSKSLFIDPELISNSARYFFEFLSWRDAIADHLETSPEEVRAAVEKTWALESSDIMRIATATVDSLKNLKDPLEAVSKIQNNSEIVGLCTRWSRIVLSTLKAAGKK